MQWDNTSNAGFTTGTPWLKVPPAAHEYNVKSESDNPDSIFNCYKRLLALRKSESALRDGEQVSINNDDPDVFAFVRRSRDETVIVALNMSAKLRVIQIDLRAAGVHGSKLTPLFMSPRLSGVEPQRIALQPFAGIVARVD